MLDVGRRKTLSDIAGLNPEELEDSLLWQLASAHSSGLRLVSPGPTEEAELVSVSLVQELVARLRYGVDFLAIDTPASFHERNLAAIDAVDLVCVVTSQHLPSLTATKDYLRVLEKLELPRDRGRARAQPHFVRRA